MTCVKKKHTNTDCYLIGMGLSFGGFSYAIKAILSFVGLQRLESLGSLMVYLAFGVLLLFCVLKDEYLFRNIFVAELIYLAVLFVGFASHQHLRNYYFSSFSFFRQIAIIYIPTGVVVFSLLDTKNLVFCINKVMSVCMAVLIISFFLGFTKRWDYQYFGVWLAPCVLIGFISYLERRKKSDLLFVFLGVIFLLFGGRQSLVIVLAGLFLLFFFSLSKPGMVFLVFVSVLLIMLFIALRPTLLSIYQVSNISGRALESLLSGELFDDSSRAYIYERSISLISMNGISVNGLFADRYLLQHSGEYNGWIAYAHNLFLEVYLDFGLLLGSIVIFAYLFLIIRSLLSRDTKMKKFGIALFVLSFGRLFVSSSFLFEGLFYVHLFFCLRYLPFAERGLKEDKNDSNEKRAVRVPFRGFQSIF